MFTSNHTDMPDVGGMYFEGGSWRSRQDDEWPCNTDPDRCHRCGQKAAIGGDLLCSACNPAGDWPDIPFHLVPEAAAAMERANARAAERAARAARAASVNTADARRIWASGISSQIASRSVR